MNDELNSDELDFQEILAWGEVWCWMALVMTPLIWWLQGPSVSTDQFVIRTALVTLATAGCLGFRLRAWIRRLRSSGSSKAGTSPTASNSGSQNGV
jgi:hypothetical protein